MRHRRHALALAGGVLALASMLGGCWFGGEATSQKVLEGALLGPDDVPEAWNSVAFPPESQSGKSEGFDVCGENNLTREERLPAGASSARAGFRGSSQTLVEELTSYEGERDRDAMRELRRSTGCPTWLQTTAAGSQISWRLTVVDLPQLGEETFAFRLVGAGATGAAVGQIEYVVWRRGDVVAVLQYSQTGSQVEGPEVIAIYAKKADDRLRVALD